MRPHGREYFRPMWEWHPEIKRKHPSYIPPKKARISYWDWGTPDIRVVEENKLYIMSIEKYNEFAGKVRSLAYYQGQRGGLPELNMDEFVLTISFWETVRTNLYTVRAGWASSQYPIEPKSSRNTSVFHVPNDITILQKAFNEAIDISTEAYEEWYFNRYGR